MTIQPIPIAYDAAADPARLAAANINPKTGLATDYLNHFNEAIMLLDLLPSMPECIVELIGWEPLELRGAFRGLAFQGQGTGDRRLRRPPTRSRGCGSMNSPTP